MREQTPVAEKKVQFFALLRVGSGVLEALRMSILNAQETLFSARTGQQLKRL